MPGPNWTTLQASTDLVIERLDQILVLLDTMSASLGALDTNSATMVTRLLEISSSGSSLEGKVVSGVVSVDQV